jgi:cation transport ATPase
VFFLIVGLSMSKDKFDKLSEESKTDIVEVTKEGDKIKKETLSTKKIDSLKKEKDSTAIKLGRGNLISFGGDTKIDKFVAYQKKHPDSKIDLALDSLGYDKNFTNRFLYTRAQTVNSFIKKDKRDKYATDLLSYGSVSLFIFLPIFTLFLKLFYIRRKFTYVDHLIFVFHTQTVFFMLLTILFLISFFTDVKQTWIFILLFLVYLLIAMKKFYQQGYIKTFIKFLLLNWVYLFLGIIGTTIVGLISFALY